MPISINIITCLESSCHIWVQQFVCNLSILTKYIIFTFPFSQMRKATHFVVLGHNIQTPTNAKSKVIEAPWFNPVLGRFPSDCFQIIPKGILISVHESHSGNPRTTRPLIHQSSCTGEHVEIKWSGITGMELEPGITWFWAERPHHSTTDLHFLSQDGIELSHFSDSSPWLDTGLSCITLCLLGPITVVYTVSLFQYIKQRYIVNIEQCQNTSGSWAKLPALGFYTRHPVDRADNEVFVDKIVTILNSCSLKVCWYQCLQYEPAWNTVGPSVAIQAYLGYCVTPSNYGLYPRIHRWQIVSRRAIRPRWHDAVAYIIV
jgi:hypothetical protein